jgi:predicted nucleotidyltransferase
MVKTALGLSRDEWKKYDPSLGFERNLKEKHAAIELRKREAWQIARQAAHLLRKDFGAKKVFVFGSLANDIGYNCWSDIDLAVSGVPVELFYSAVAQITGISSIFRIDLVDMDDCRPGLKKVIEQAGHEI